MFKIQEIIISGFWGKFTIKSSFYESVNIIIGKNGTGKTTFMNILYAVLCVDPDGLYENDFLEVKIKLIDGKRAKTITATKGENTTSPFPVVTYYISNHKYLLPIVVNDEFRVYPTIHRRKSVEESTKIRIVLSEFIKISSLSVYRYRQDPDSNNREINKRSLSPVDSRLEELMQHLTQYQYTLLEQARGISTALQKNVLISLLYNPDQKSKNNYSVQDINEEQAKQDLSIAYKQLGLNDKDISNKIQKHITAISIALKALKNKDTATDLSPLLAKRNTDNITEMSLEAKKGIDNIFAPIGGFLETVASFIPSSEKCFEFIGGKLVAKAMPAKNSISLIKLSSGEKQLLILLIEALLQKCEPYIFLADEPELSLHISWQREIIPAITKLNPNAQIIVATHSPEVASKFESQIIDMKDIING